MKWIVVYFAMCGVGGWVAGDLNASPVQVLLFWAWSVAGFIAGRRA